MLAVLACHLSQPTYIRRANGSIFKCCEVFCRQDPLSKQHHILGMTTEWSLYLFIYWGPLLYCLGTALGRSCIILCSPYNLDTNGAEERVHKIFLVCPLLSKIIHMHTLQGWAPGWLKEWFFLHLTLQYALYSCAVLIPLLIVCFCVNFRNCVCATSIYIPCC